MVDEMRAGRSKVDRGGADVASSGYKSNAIRGKILETIKKGISDARDRTDLADGETLRCNGDTKAHSW